MEWEWRYLNNEGGLRRLESQLGAENFQLLITGSYGDILPNLALLNAFHKINARKIAVLVGEHWRLLAKRFDYEFINYHFISGSQTSWLHEVLCSSGRPFIRSMGYMFPTLPTLHPWVADFILTERVSDWEAKRAILGLAVGTKMEIPPLEHTRSDEISRTMADLGIGKDEGVLLSFHSNSNPIVKLQTQLTIAKLFLLRGLKVVFNTSGWASDQSFLKELKSLGVTLYDVPPDAPFEIVEHIGMYIGSAHGLTAMLATLPCKAKIIQVLETDAPLVRNNNRLITVESLRVDRALRGEPLNDVSIVTLDEDMETRILKASEK